MDYKITFDTPAAQYICDPYAEVWGILPWATESKWCSCWLCMCRKEWWCKIGKLKLHTTKPLRAFDE